MPELDGAQVLNAVVRDKIPTRVLFLSTHTESAKVYDLLAHGASGYLDKTSSAEEVCNAIVAAARGETVLSQSIEGDVLQQIRIRAEDTSTSSPLVSRRCFGWWPTVTPARTSPSSSTSRPRPSRPTSSTSTRSWACRSERPQSQKQCAADCSSRADARRGGVSPPRAVPVVPSGGVGAAEQQVAAGEAGDSEQGQRQGAAEAGGGKRFGVLAGLDHRDGRGVAGPRVPSSP